MIRFRIMAKSDTLKPAVVTGPTGKMTSFNVQRLRKLRGWTQSELAHRMTELGRKMSLSTISEIELRTRRVDVDDLVALAAALQVAPNDLLLPPVKGPGLQCEITGLGVVSTTSAWSWATGFWSPAWPKAPRGWAQRSRLKLVESPEEQDRRERERMVETMLEAADKRHRTLAETPGVPTEAITAAAAEVERLELIDPADEDYWRSAPYDPARSDDGEPRPTVADQVADIQGLSELVTVKPAATVDPA